MTQADCVFITPPTSTSRLQNIHEQEAARQASLEAVRRLRREAAAEIERLIAFMDASDTYVMTELEDDGDQDDASYPTSGAHCANPMEDDEDSDPAEYDDTGIGDVDGLMEQFPERFAHCDVRVEA
jgi:hypothetical protein